MSNPNTSRSSFDQAGFENFLNASSDSLSNPSSPRKKPRKKRQPKKGIDYDSISESSSSEMALIGTGKSFMKKPSAPASGSGRAAPSSTANHLDDTLQQPGLASMNQPDSGELRLQLDRSSQEFSSNKEEKQPQQQQQQQQQQRRQARLADGTGLSQQAISEIGDYESDAEMEEEEEPAADVTGIGNQHKPSMLSRVSLLDSCESTSQLRTVSHNGDTVNSHTDMSAVRDAYRRKLDTLTESSDSHHHQLPSNTTGLSGLNNATTQQQQQQQTSVAGTQSFGLRPLQPPEQKEMSIDDLLAEHDEALTDRKQDSQRGQQQQQVDEEEEDEEDESEEEEEEDQEEVQDELDGRLSFSELQQQHQQQQVTIVAPPAAKRPPKQQQQQQQQQRSESVADAKPQARPRAFDETRVVINPRFSQQQQQQQQQPKRFGHVKSSGYGRTTVMKRQSASAAGRVPAAPAAAAQAKQRNSAAAGIGRQQQQPAANNFYAVERQRLIEEVADVREQLKAERAHNQKLQSNLNVQQHLAAKEAEEQRQQHNQQLLSLKQENSVLEAKLEAAETKATSLPQWKLLKERPAGPGVTRDEIQELAEQMQQQESLLTGYQRENERLYDEMKAVRASNKALVDTLTNQKLAIELELKELRGQLQQKELQLQSHAPERRGNGPIANAATLVSDAGRAAQLDAELRAAKRRCEQQQAELASRDRDRCELENQIDKCVREKVELEERLVLAKSVKGVEIDKMKEAYESELDKLQRKVKWFIENQRLVDKDQVRLKEKDEQIAELQDRLQLALQSGAAAEQQQQQQQLQQPDAAAGRVRDLQRQVKELEGILRKRDEPNVFQSSVRQHLEQRVRELEQQLADRQSAEARSARALRQRYEAAKEDADARIKVLEADLKRFKEAKDRPHSSLTSLQRELDAMRVRFKEKVLEKDRELQKLRTELSAEVLQTQNEKRAIARAEALQRELRERQLEVDKLRRERDRERDTQRQWTKQQQQQQQLAQRLQRENDSLKQQAAVLENSTNSARTELASARNEQLEARRRFDRQLTEMQEFHRREVDRLVGEHAKTFADSRVAQLQAQQDTQEMMIEHLKRQLATAGTDSQEVERLKRREQQLMAEAKELRSALEDERGAHTPQMRQFVTLRDQIRQLEQRYQQRERELDKVLHDAKASARQDAMAEAGKWKQLVDTKTKQIDQFRSELDLILEVLRQLQRQGVSLPVPASLKSTLASL